MIHGGPDRRSDQGSDRLRDHRKHLLTERWMAAADASDWQGSVGSPIIGGLRLAYLSQ